MALIVTPGQILDSATQLGGDMDRLAIDIEGSAVPDEFKEQWRAFYGRWLYWYADLDYIDRLWGGTQEQIDSFRSDLVAWEKKYQSAGGKVVGPSIADVPIPTNLLGDIKWIVLGVLGVALLLRFGGK